MGQGIQEWIKLNMWKTASDPWLVHFPLNSHPEYQFISK